jgi:hypothetical protein
MQNNGTVQLPKQAKLTLNRGKINRDSLLGMKVLMENGIKV